MKPSVVLEEQRRSLGPDQFSAQYLQEPVAAGGNMFKRDWIERYKDRPFREHGDIVLQSWDTASKTAPQNDWSVCTTWLVRGGNYYLLDVFRDKVDYPRLIKEAERLINQHDPSIVLVEDTNIGTGLAAVLRGSCRNIKPVTVKDSKEQRASVEANKFYCGRVFLPEKARWLAEFEAELFAFPGSKHDDQVDSSVQALAHDITIGRYGARPLRGQT